ncbi:MAG: TetR/AcrR family transcriptional regulator [Myxococcota bacterium]|nr:TetR/AcrR family transcriptional regulator [Myxococcota bacterium]
MPKSRWISDLHWVRTGQQSRSQRTQEALLDAAATLVAEKGVEAASVADVARQAGCSVGSVYHHFRDKQTLVYAVVDRMTEELRATTEQAVEPSRWEGASVMDILQGMLEFSLEIGRDRPKVKDAVYEIARHDPQIREHLAGLRSELHEALFELLLARSAEIGHADPALAIRFVLDQMAGMMLLRLHELFVPTELEGISDPEFIDEVLRSARAYLAIPA